MKIVKTLSCPENYFKLINMFFNKFFNKTFYLLFYSFLLLIFNSKDNRAAANFRQLDWLRAVSHKYFYLLIITWK